MHSKTPKNKIIITGDAARGKTTLANRLGNFLKTHVYHTDDVYWQIKYTTPRDKESALQQMIDIYSQDKWIVEGTTWFLIQPGLEKAELIIYLRYNNIAVQWLTLIRRHLKRDNETVTNLFKLMRHVFYKRYSLGYKKGESHILNRLQIYDNKLIVLNSYKQINIFLNAFNK